MKNRFAFTMIELIFVIVIMGILAKFGVEFLAQAYNNFFLSKINNTLQSQSASAVETIASRLQFRIKDSIIARDVTQPDLSYEALSGSTLDDNATVLEWVASDIDGFRGNKWPLWSGIIDLDASTATLLNSPGTDTATLDAQIQILSHNSGTSINNSAIYFIGSDNDITRYGWDGALTDHNTSVMHPINSTGNIDEFASGIVGVDFNGTDIYEYYQLAWTAYAVEHNATSRDLTLYYDYQPWEGESYTSGQEALIMQNVSTFRFKAIGSVVKIQVCVDANITDGGYSICKEKTIF